MPTSAKTQDLPFFIPEDIQKKFPEMIKLILESKAMDNLEARGWIYSLPALNSEQMDELRSILEEEKAREAEYKKREEEFLARLHETDPAFVSARKEKFQNLHQAENLHRSQAEEEAEDLLLDL